MRLTKPDSTHGVRLSLYSLAIVSMPPPRATAMKQDSFPTSNPTTDISASTDPLFLALGVSNSLYQTTAPHFTWCLSQRRQAGNAGSHFQYYKWKCDVMYLASSLQNSKFVACSPGSSCSNDGYQPDESLSSG